MALIIEETRCLAIQATVLVGIFYLLVFGMEKNPGNRT
jgi:hypothetical protein